MTCRASSLSRHTRPWVGGEGWEGGDTGRGTLVPYHSTRSSTLCISQSVNPTHSMGHHSLHTYVLIGQVAVSMYIHDV